MAAARRLDTWHCPANHSGRARCCSRENRLTFGPGQRGQVGGRVTSCFFPSLIRRDRSTTYCFTTSRPCASRETESTTGEKKIVLSHTKVSSTIEFCFIMLCSSNYPQRRLFNLSRWLSSHPANSIHRTFRFPGMNASFTAQTTNTIILEPLPGVQ
jgi:hypothetical protein